MKNEKFKTAYEKVKSYLADSLTAENADKITELSKDLETMQEAMEKEESDHLATKDKLVDYVKNTSFKKEVADDPVDDSPKTMAEAEEIALNKILEARKNKEKEKN